MVERPNRRNRVYRRQKADNPGWTKEWQDEVKFTTLFLNPGIAFMDCQWLQSAMTKLLVLSDNPSGIKEYVDANGTRGGRLPAWFVESLASHLRKGDMRPIIKGFREKFGEYLSEQVLHDLRQIAFTRNAIGHCYISAGRHIDRDIRTSAPLIYYPRDTREFPQDRDPALKGWAIEADSEWMSTHDARLVRIFEICEVIAEDLGIPGHMVY